MRGDSDVQEGRGEGRGGAFPMAENWNLVGAAHDLPAAESPVSAVAPALPPAGSGAGPEIVCRAFVFGAYAGPFWLALPWWRGRFP